VAYCRLLARGGSKQTATLSGAATLTRKSKCSENEVEGMEGRTLPRIASPIHNRIDEDSSSTNAK
jgi:hypothetical protein